jgi:CelD/BcsL family acetyltransferase involved in cellulose biosynthesis
MGIRIATIQTAEDFASLASEWTALLGDSRQDSPYLCHALLSLWWRVLGTGCMLHTLTCRDDGGALLGVLPAYVDACGPLLKARSLRLLGDTRTGATGLGPFARTDAETAVFDAFAEHLAAAADWDVLDFRFVDPASPFLAHRLHANGGSRIVRRDVHASPVVALPGDFESYLMDVLPAKKRENLRRCRRRTEAAGAAVEMVDDPAALSGAVDDVFRLFTARMRVVVGPDFAVSAKYREFAEALAAQLLTAGQLRLGFLAIEGQRVAFAQLFRYRETTYAMRSGFDPEWGRLEVLKALNSHMIERAIAEGCRWFDFGLGDQEYKQGWGAAETRHFSDVRVYSGSAASRACKARSSVRDWGVDSVLAAPDGVRKPLLSVGRLTRKMLRGGRES